MPHAVSRVLAGEIVGRTQSLALASPLRNMSLIWLTTRADTLGEGEAALLQPYRAGSKA